MNKNELTITTDLGDTVRCRSYFNDDIDNGIELFINDNRLGSLHGYCLPDEDDEKGIKEFTNVLEDWLIDNN